jgi:hypothetical protein
MKHIRAVVNATTNRPKRRPIILSLSRQSLAVAFMYLYVCRNGPSSAVIRQTILRVFLRLLFKCSFARLSDSCFRGALYATTLLAQYLGTVLQMLSRPLELRCLLV